MKIAKKQRLRILAAALAAAVVCGTWSATPMVYADDVLSDVQMLEEGLETEEIMSQEFDLGDIPSYTLESGSAIVEAEDIIVNTALVTVREEAETAANGKSVEFTFDDRNVPQVDAQPGIGFEFEADKAGNYYVWARLVCMTDGNDSCFLSVGDEEYAYWGLPIEGSGEYQWQKIAAIPLEESGIGRIRLIPRETGARFDRFIVTRNMAYIPEGMGELPGEAGDTVVKFPEGVYEMPDILPENGVHPRVMFREEDLDAIRLNMESSEEAAAKAAFEDLKETEFDGILSSGTAANYDGKLLSVIEAKAFDYAVFGNQENGEAAISAIQNYIQTCSFTGISDSSRAMGHVLFTAAEVYDWCYDLLDEEDQTAIVAGCQLISMQMEIGFPPNGQGAVSGHGGEAQLMRDWLSLAIAVYDEYPDIYHYVGGRFFEEFTETRNYWTTSQTQHQGSAYGIYRHLWDLWGQWLIYRMSGEVIYTDDMGKVPYQWIYTRRPDGQLLREGDDYNENYLGKGKYWNVLGNMLFYSANFYKDPILKEELLRENENLASFNYTNDTLTPVQILAFNDPEVGQESYSSLPLTKYYPSPLGQMTARTGWNMGTGSPDVLAFMKIGELWAANHNHLDAGNFQIYYKGILASESGFYESYGTNHDANYNKESIAHNVLHIVDPDEVGSAAISGGQRRPGGEVNTLDAWLKDDQYRMGEVIGQEFGPDTQIPEYTYLAGDITDAYTDKVDEVLRSMLFLPLDEEEYPAAFVVFDKITSVNPQAEKKFLLHMQEEPEVNGNVTVIRRTEDGYNGMLTNQTLLPADASIQKIGGEGQEYMIGDENYATQNPISPELPVEAGWGRVEISPAEAQNNTDYFLNVMYVGDADLEADVVEAELIENDVVAGAKIFNRVAVFNKNKARIEENVEFDIPGVAGESLQVNVAGLKEGTWSIYLNDSLIGEEISSKDGGIIYFTASAGKCRLVRTGENSDKEFTHTDPEETETTSITLNGNYLYFKNKPVVEENVVLAPMMELGTYLNAETMQDGETGIVKGPFSEVRMTAAQETAYVDGQAVVMPISAQILDGVLYAPAQFLAEALGATVKWNAVSKELDISARTQEHVWDIPNQIWVKEAIQSGDDGSGNTIMNSLDGLLTTRWAPEGKDGDAWGIYDLGKEYTLDKVYLSYHNGDSRTYYFDIAVSTDGIHYTTVLENGQSSGTTLELEEYPLNGVKARYVKYIGGGNSVNLWNSVTEIVFTQIETTDPIVPETPDESLPYIPDHSDGENQQESSDNREEMVQHYSSNDGQGTWELYKDGTWMFRIGDSLTSGWKFIDNVWYYFQSDGKMTTGWQLVNGVWYYLKDWGGMATGWQLINGTWYYLKDWGGMATGWQFINGAWYYLKDWGGMATGWQMVDSVWYYFGTDGKMFANTRTPDGYYVDHNGKYYPAS